MTRSLSIKERIERNVTVWLLGTLFTGFVAGVGAYRTFREIVGYQEITKVEVDKLKSERDKANSAKINLEKQLSVAKKEIDSLKKLRTNTPAIKKDSKASASSALTGVSVSIFFKAEQFREARKMEEKLNSVGAKAEASQESLPSHRTPGVVYYLHPSKFKAAAALIDLFPEMGFNKPELLLFSQSAFEGTDVFLYLP